MKDQNQTNNLSLGIVASVCALAVAVGGGIALWTNLQSTTTKTSDNSQTFTTPLLQAHLMTLCLPHLLLKLNLQTLFLWMCLNPKQLQKNCRTLLGQKCC